MLRAVLLASPLALVLVVSCTSSDTIDFKDTGPSSTAGTMSAASGASAGGTSSQGGSNAAAGTNAAAGKTSNGGNGNNAGTGNNNGGRGGKGNGNAGDPGNMAGDTGTNGGAADTGGSNTGGSNTGGTTNGGTDTGGTTNGGTTNGGTGGTNGGPLCPDIFGDYTITNVDGGQNCNFLNKNASQKISGTDVACFAHFQSVGGTPQANVGVNGGAALDENGDFTGATLKLNQTQRLGCSGVWDAKNERMTVKCGGAGEQCTVVMERN